MIARNTRPDSGELANRTTIGRASIQLARVALFVGMCALVGCADTTVDPSGGENPSTSEVLSTIEAYDQAWAAKDTATVREILTGNYTYFSSSGGVRSGDWLLRELLGHPGYQLDYSDRTELQVTDYGTAAVVSSRWRGEGSYNGRPIRDDQRCSLVVIRDGVQLNIAAEHCTEIAR